jgi:tetratricopeptide (TPR) repeat protein
MMQRMLFTWIKAQDAVDAGARLADAFPFQATGEFLRPFVQQATRDLQARKLNFYKRVRFANAFKWRLLEKGVPAETAHEVTQTLLINTSVGLPSIAPLPATATRPAMATTAVARPDRMPKDSGKLTTLGLELIQQGRYAEARKYFQRAVARNPKNAEAMSNLGYLWLIQGRFADAENHYRQALRIRPTDPNIGAQLGLALFNQGLIDKARAQFDKVLKTSPRCAAALSGLGTVERAAGHFKEAEQAFQRALEADPSLTGSLAAIAGTRRMTASDSQWLAKAEHAADAAKNPTEEASLRFAVGKYFNDVGDYSRAFASYQRANTLLKPLAAPYDGNEHSRFVNDMTCVYTPPALAAAKAGGSSSKRPVFVVGMPRSGTSLLEQILSSHPSVAGAGELKFWIDAVAADEARIRTDILPQESRQKLAADYLRTLQARHRDAEYVIDKTPSNADYLGLIHSVFPDARIIHMRRDPIDTCLSCYFQGFTLAHNYKFDLNDLANYYRQHARLMAHWRKVLPAGTLFEVPYEELVSQQESWTRKLLEFLGLEWDVSCLKFNQNTRPVVTASSWQVRQPIYNDSVERWRHYAKFVEPLRKLDP